MNFKYQYFTPQETSQSSCSLYFALYINNILEGERGGGGGGGGSQRSISLYETLSVELQFASKNLGGGK